MTHERSDGLSRRRFIKTVGAVGVAATLPPYAMTARATPAPPTLRRALRFGIYTPQRVPYKDMVGTWKLADDLGYDTLFGFDHFMPISGDLTGPCLEGWTLLAALAAQTSRARVGLLVTGNTYRFPAVLAKMAATVDQVSNGRLILGMGAGWFEPEHKAYGIPFYTVGERARRLGEAVQVLKLLFTQSKSTFSGAYYQLADASCEPKPVQRPYPPILIGGTGPKLIQPIVARHADIWHFYVAKADREATRTLCAHFDAVCRQVGRDPATIEKSTFLLGDQLLGSPQDVRAGILSLVAAGVHHFILVPPPPYDAALLRRFAREVIPAVRDRHRGAVG